MRFELVPGIHGFTDPKRRDRFGGLGFLGGMLPAGLEDGRAKIMNVPTRVDITVLEAVTFTVVARTTSKEDGTWRVLYLDPGQIFAVIGSDRRMTVNSAIQDWVRPAPLDP